MEEAPLSIRRGLARVYSKKRFFATLSSWPKRLLTLTDINLIIDNDGGRGDPLVLELQFIMQAEKTSLFRVRQPHCLMLATTQRRYYISFKNQQQLDVWHSDICLRIRHYLRDVSTGAKELHTTKSSHTKVMGSVRNDSISTTRSLLPGMELPLSGVPQPSIVAPDELPNPGSTLSLPSALSLVTSSDIRDEDPVMSPRSFQHLPPLPPEPRLRRMRRVKRLSFLRKDPEQISPQVTELSSEQQKLIRQAICIICHMMKPRMLRSSLPAGDRHIDEVEVRIRGLVMLRRAWSKTGTHVIATDAKDKDDQVFCEVLRDGYVLCQLFNALHLGSSVLADAYADGFVKSNVTKFLEACKSIGLPAESLFLPNDLTEPTNESLARVAQTIVDLEGFSVKTALDEPQISKEPLSSSSDESEGIDDAYDRLQPDSPPSDLPDTSPQSPSIKLQEDPPWTPHGKAQWLDGLLDAYPTEHTTVAASNLLPPDSYTPTGLSDSGEIVVLPSILRSDSLVSTELPYQKLFSYLYEVAIDLQSVEAERLSTTLCQLHAFMKALDPTKALLESQHCRIMLMQVATVLNVPSDSHVHHILQEDEDDLANTLISVVCSEVGRQAILALRGEDAHRCLDLIQDVLDKRSLEMLDNHEFDFRAHKLLVKLSENCDALPSSLFVKGVQRRDQEASFGGSYGDIYRAAYNGQDVALKRMRVFQRDISRHKIRQKFCREALVWQRLKHPNVLPFLGVDAKTFPNFLCMVSPWMRRGTILKHLAENNRANVDERLLEIAEGLAYLHSMNVIHGDLRGSNILIDNDWHACIADFGLAVFSDATVATSTSSRGGSLRWMAPELQDPEAQGLERFKRTSASDVYSYGCVCLELYTGCPPFMNVSHDAAALLKVMKGERPERPSGQPGRIISDDLWALIEKCWSHRFIDRPSTTTVVQHMRCLVKVADVQSPDQ